MLGMEGKVNRALEWDGPTLPVGLIIPGGQRSEMSVPAARVGLTSPPWAQLPAGPLTPSQPVLTLRYA